MIVITGVATAIAVTNSHKNNETTDTIEITQDKGTTESTLLQEEQAVETTTTADETTTTEIANTNSDSNASNQSSSGSSNSSNKKPSNDGSNSKPSGGSHEDSAGLPTAPPPKPTKPPVPQHNLTTEEREYINLINAEKKQVYDLLNSITKVTEALKLEHKKYVLKKVTNALMEPIETLHLLGMK